MERITDKMVAASLQRYVNALEYAGIKYDGRHGVTMGSKTYGIAYRLYRTDVMDRCQRRGWNESHEGCEACGGTGMARCSGHYSPVVGDDYLGMTARDAKTTLDAMVSAIYGTARAMREAPCTLDAAQNA